jgi:hypothetical protein
MQTIEAQMHSLLEDIAPDAHTSEEQAKIIAQASAIYKKIFSNRRLARKASAKIIESHMTDAILQAMGSLNNWNEEYEENYIESSGLTNRQVISRVSTASKPNWGMMDVLNPDVLDFMDFDEDESQQTLENAQQTSEALITPGRGRHRSDFISNETR